MTISPPPSGYKWHLPLMKNADEYYHMTYYHMTPKAEDYHLEEGWRPLVVGERFPEGYEFFNLKGEWEVGSMCGMIAGGHYNKYCHMRTKRPLCDLGQTEIQINLPLKLKRGRAKTKAKAAVEVVTVPDEEEI